MVNTRISSAATRPLRSYEPFIGLMGRMDHPLLGILAGAAMSWNVESADVEREPNWAGMLDAHVFCDSAGVMGEIAYDMGENVRLGCQAKINGNCGVRALVIPKVSLT